MMVPDSYVVDEAVAMDALQDIYSKLCCEDQTLRTFRRSIGFGHFIRDHLIPLLLNAKSEQTINMTIRLMVNLTLPIECLYSVDIMSRTEAGRANVTEIGQLLLISKKCFTEARVIRAIVDHLKSILEKDSRFTDVQCDNINNCLLLIRNVLHILETSNVAATPSVAMQNRILWHLFTMSIDKFLIHLMSCPQRGAFSVAIVQLIALMYRDQNINTLKNLLSLWFDASVSDSSDDYESNTTPLKQRSGKSSPMLTSDSSDNGGNVNGSTMMDTQSVIPKKVVNPKNLKIKSVEVFSSTAMHKRKSVDMDRELDCSVSMAQLRKKLSISELSDCGYGTQVENAEVMSTSSNDDDMPMAHQKPPLTNQKQRFNAVNNPRSAITIQDKKEWRRKKLVKRSKSSLINMKGLLHHTPSDEAISNILKEFTVDFLLKGYGYLVHELHAQTLIQSEFFTAQLEMDLEHIKFVLSFDIISYLTYEGVSLCEELELINANQDGMDNKSCLRRMHLVVTSIREFLQVLNAYKKINHLTKEDQYYIHLLILQISSSTNLHCLFVLLLRQYNPMLQSKQYLQDVIVTNHILLVLLDEASKFTDFTGNLNMLDHIEQFATVDVMHKYGLLLADFQKNGEFVNDCIFTMMHHICGDIGQVVSLFQPTILKTFSNIFQTEYELCDDWSDLIEYIMHKFLNTPQKNALSLPRQFLADVTMTVAPEREMWSKEEIDTLYWYYVQSKKSSDIIGSIIKLLSTNGFKAKSRLTVIQQLLQQDIISLLKYDDLMKSEDIDYERNTKTPDGTSSNDESGIYLRDSTSGVDRINDDIQVLTDRLQAEHKGKSLLWLQKTLVDCCFVKLLLKRRTYNCTDADVTEPVPFHYSLKHQSVPVVPWNAEQSGIMLYEPFMLLLHKLGFHLPADSGKIFVRIPEFWTADTLYKVAEKLGPVDQSLLRFDLSELTEHHQQQQHPHHHHLGAHLQEHYIYGMDKRYNTRYERNQLSQCNKSDWLDTGRKSKIDSSNNNSKNLSTNDVNHIDESTAVIMNELKVSHHHDRVPADDHKHNNILPDVEEETESTMNDDFGEFFDDSALVRLCDTVSISSDLTQIYDLYVSDEDES